MNSELTCGQCSQPLRELRDACLLCGRYPDAVRRDVEQSVEQLVRLHDALANAIHIDVPYQRALVEQDLRSYGVDPTAQTGQTTSAPRTRKQRPGSRG